MKLARHDLRQLRWPLLFAAVLIFAGAAMMIFTHYSLEAAKRERAASLAKRTAAQQRVAKVAEEEREIRNHLVLYQRMVDAGMVGSKNRLDLIDSIAAIKTARKLFDIRYRIEPQKPLDYPGIARTRTVDFVSSRMQLDMKLLHEEDLLRFLADLRADRQSHISVRHCNLAREDRPSATVAPNIQAHCQLDMITLTDTGESS